MQLILSNFGPLGSVEFDFDAGLNAVVGPNGCGKSTLVSALYFAFTGDPINGQNLSELISWGASKASVTLKCDTLTVTRELSLNGTTKLRLLVAGKEITRRKEADEAICEAFGFVDLSILKLVFFAEQYHAIDFVEVTDLSRTQMLSSLFGFAGLEKLRSILQDSIRNLDVSKVDDIVLDNLKQALEQAKASRFQFIDAQRSAEAKIIQVPTFEAFERVAKAPVEGTIFELNADVSEIDTKLKELDASLSLWPEPPTEAQSKAASMYVHRRTLTEQLIEYKKELDDLKSAVDVPNAEDVAKLLELVRNNKAQVTANILSARKRKDLLKAGKCPLTGSEPCPDLLALSNTDQVDLDVVKLEAELQSLATDEAALTAAYNDATMHKNALDAAKARVADTEKLLTLCDVPEDFDYVAYEAAIKIDFSERDRLLGERAQLQQRRIDLCLKLDELKDVEEHTVEEIEAAKKALEESRNAAAEYRALETSIKAAEKHVADCAASLNFALEQNSRADKVLVKREFLEKVRTALHQDNLPRMLVEDMLVELNARLNQRLTEFNFPYEVSWMPGGALMYREGSDAWHKAAQLSGGQKYVLVLALRCAILEMLHSKFKLFVLDEPTTGLDRANREALSSVLLQVANSDLKPILVVPTHDELLLPEAKVVELG